MSIDSASESPAGSHVTQSESAASSASGESNAKTQDDSIAQPTKSSLLSSILSPFSSLLSISSTQESEKQPAPETVSTPEPASEPKAETKEQEEEVETKEPEAYYTPNEVPKFKLLQKKRLSGTRTKQLLRAAGRAYNDPPPQPELGMCCGSSCDPCVNDLWREEREVWRERWGDRRVEGDEGNLRAELVW
ncbi:hypothetical protein N7493_004365 [Penicillium malachiteum]|uniref:Oxidoreductase-like domain-containing protein n=1 Tax=Penicillium malachiteum TaxID=1324776 RepID=A0AAD6HNF2_9EURO|nr:hypothetical protein N7493_004365 [Penicillium malachiteum]